MLTGKMPFGIKTMQDLRNIVTKDIDLSSIADPTARSFISAILIKDPLLRKDISEICEHEFIRQEGSNQYK
jgi:serine/threonine protein kinase